MQPCASRGQCVGRTFGQPWSNPRDWASRGENPRCHHNAAAWRLATTNPQANVHGGMRAVRFASEAMEFCMSFSKRQFLGLAAAVILVPAVAVAQDLPNLQGRKVVVVTENAYPPLQFVDPKDRQGDRLGI
jgi:hypothetical protein